MFAPIRQFIALTVLTTFIGSSLPIPQAQAQAMPWMPKPGVRVGLSPEFTPAHLQGMIIHSDNALKFDFLIHRGDSTLDESQKRVEYDKLVKYFMASLTVPDDNQWVNLSPYEKNRIVEKDFGTTEMGRDLLAQDYLLKQMASSLMYPEESLGKKFWDKVFERSQQQFGTTNIPVNTINKVWIVPGKATLFEKGDTVFILDNRLKVMMEEDYLALKKNSIKGDRVTNPIPSTHDISSKLVKEIIIPELEKEVNEGKNFAPLRQVYNSMLLAAWYKRALKESLLGKVYANRAKVDGVNTNDPQANQEIYQQYLAAFKKGVFNYIKEDVDKFSKQPIPRKYFSGGTEAYGKGRYDRDVQKKNRLAPDEAIIANNNLVNADRAVVVVAAQDQAISGKQHEQRVELEQSATRLARFLTGFEIQGRGDQAMTIKKIALKVFTQRDVFPEPSVLKVNQDGKVEIDYQQFQDNYSNAFGDGDRPVQALIRLGHEQDIRKFLDAINRSGYTKKELRLALRMMYAANQWIGGAEHKFLEIMSMNGINEQHPLFYKNLELMLLLQKFMNTFYDEGYSFIEQLLGLSMKPLWIENNFYGALEKKIQKQGFDPQAKWQGTLERYQTNKSQGVVRRSIERYLVTTAGQGLMTSLGEVSQDREFIIQAIDQLANRDATFREQLAYEGEINLDYLRGPYLFNFLSMVLMRFLQNPNAVLPDIPSTDQERIDRLFLENELSVRSFFGPRIMQQESMLKKLFYQVYQQINTQEEIQYPTYEEVHFALKSAHDQTIALNILYNVSYETGPIMTREELIDPVGIINLENLTVKGQGIIKNYIQRIKFFEGHLKVVETREGRIVSLNEVGLTVDFIGEMLTQYPKEVVRISVKEEEMDTRGSLKSYIHGVDQQRRTVFVKGRVYRKHDGLIEISSTYSPNALEVKFAHPPMIEKPKEPIDAAMSINPDPKQQVTDTDIPLGGIDLNAANLDMRIQRDGNGVPLPLSQQNMDMLMKINGFVPVIIDIKPINELPLFVQLKQQFNAAS